jgi:hypothetical protein
VQGCARFRPPEFDEKASREIGEQFKRRDGFTKEGKYGESIATSKGLHIPPDDKDIFYLPGT